MAYIFIKCKHVIKMAQNLSNPHCEGYNKDVELNFHIFSNLTPDRSKWPATKKKKKTAASIPYL
jgi:hypothetical protein